MRIEFLKRTATAALVATAAYAVDFDTNSNGDLTIGLGTVANAQTRPGPGCGNEPCDDDDDRIVIDNNIDNNIDNDIDVDVDNDQEQRQNQEQTLNNNQQFHFEGDINASAPTATATSNGWVCERRLGLSVGVGVSGLGVSGGINAPIGNNQKCVDTMYSNTMIESGVSLIINGRSHEVQRSGADAFAIGVGTMMQNSDKFNEAARHVFDQNCGTLNFADRFRTCGTVTVRGGHQYAQPRYTK